MKKIKTKIKILNYLIKDRFIILTAFLTILITCLISKYTVIRGDSLLNNYVFATGGGWFSFTVLIMFFVSYIYIHARLDSNYSYRIRNTDSKSTIIDIIKYSIMINLIMYIIMFVLNILLIMPSSNLKDFDIMYFIFYIVRNFLMYNIMSLLNYVIFKFIDKKVSIVIVSILAYLSYAVTTNNEMISSLLNMKLNPAYYLVSLNYSSFFFEIIITLFYISVLITIIAFIFHYFMKRSVDDEI